MPKIPPIRLLGGLGSGGGFFEERLGHHRIAGTM